MTGFGKSSMENDEISVSCDMRSLNGKFIDIDIRLPKHLYEIDVEIRKNISSILTRGSVVLVFSIVNKPSTVAQNISVNKSLASLYQKEFSNLEKELNLESKDLFSEIIGRPEIIQTNEAGYSDASRKLIVDCAIAAANKLIEFRKAEGQVLNDDLLKNISAIEEKLEQIKTHEDPRKEALREKMYGHLSQHVDKDKIDENRFEQELMHYLDKWDVSEEKIRLAQHLVYFRETIAIPKSGKKLYFINQEMNRESNTLGVKSNYFPIQQLIVEVKERLEQIKEQVMNIV